MSKTTIGNGIKNPEITREKNYKWNEIPDNAHFNVVKGEVEKILDKITLEDFTPEFLKGFKKPIFDEEIGSWFLIYKDGYSYLKSDGKLYFGRKNNSFNSLGEIYKVLDQVNKRRNEEKKVKKLIKIIKNNIDNYEYDFLIDLLNKSKIVFGENFDFYVKKRKKGVSILLTDTRENYSYKSCGINLKEEGCYKISELIYEKLNNFRKEEGLKKDFILVENLIYFLNKNKDIDLLKFVFNKCLTKENELIRYFEILKKSPSFRTLSDYS